MTYLSIQTFITKIENELFEFIAANIRKKDQSYFPKYGLDIKSATSLKKLTLSTFLDTFFQELPEEKIQLLTTGFLISYLVETQKMTINNILKEFNLSQSEATKSVKFTKRYLILENEKSAIKAYEFELENIRFLKDEIKKTTLQIRATNKIKREELLLATQRELRLTLELLKNTSFKDAYSSKKMNFKKGDILNSDVIEFLFNEEKSLLNAIVEYRLEQNVIGKYKELKKDSAQIQKGIIIRTQKAIGVLEELKKELKKRLQTKEYNLKLEYTF